MVLYLCHSDTTRCRVYDQSGVEYLPAWYGLRKWRIQNSDLYASEHDCFPDTGEVELIPTVGSVGNRFARELTSTRVKVSALTFRRCFEKADEMWKLKEEENG